MLHAMYVQVPVSSMGSLQVHVGPHGSTQLDRLPPPKVDGGSVVQTPQVVTRQTAHEHMEQALPPSHSISRDISATGLKGSFSVQDGGASLSWSDEPHVNQNQWPVCWRHISIICIC